MPTAGAGEHPFGINESRPATGTSPQAWTRGVGSAQQQPAAAVTYKKQIDIKAGLKDGSLTSDDAIVLMEEQMEKKMTTQIAKLRAELSVVSGAVVEGAEGAASPLASVVRGLVARLTETPTNFHQATVFFRRQDFLAADAPEDAAMARRAPLLHF